MMMRADTEVRLSFFRDGTEAAPYNNHETVTGQFQAHQFKF
jgi:hypothetical protein